MADKTPATLAELKTTFKNSTAEWRESQMEAGNSLPESAIAYASFVETKAAEERTAHTKALEDVKKTAKEEAANEVKTAADKAKIKGGSLGQQPLTANNDGGGYDSESGDAIEDYNAAVAKIAGPNPDMQKRQRAIRQIASTKPELHMAYLLANNPGKKQTRLITEKMEAISK